MFLPAVLLFFFVTPNALGDDLKNRIMYGQKADIKDFPYFAALKDCGAAIISDSWLVTAAHCVVLDDLKFGSAWVGGNNTKISQEVKYDAVVIHPEFDVASPLLSNNIALLRLAEPLRLSEKVKPVDLESQYYNEHRDYYGGHTYTVAAKGMREGNLMKMNVTLIRMEECMNYFSLAERIELYYYRHLFAEYLCTKRVTQYDDDDMPGLSQSASGSPLVMDNYLIGLAVTSTFRKPEGSRVSMFVNINRHSEWIRFITGIQADNYLRSTPSPYYK